MRGHPRADAPPLAPRRRLDEGAAAAVSEAVERAARTIGERIGKDGVVAQLSEEQWGVLGRRLSALEEAVGGVEGAVGDKLREEVAKAVGAVKEATEVR